MTTTRNIFSLLFVLACVSCASQSHQDYKHLMGSLGPSCKSLREEVPTLIRKDEEVQKAEPLAKEVMQVVANVVENMDEQTCKSFTLRSIAPICIDFIRNPGRQEAMCQEYSDLCPEGDPERMQGLCEEIVIVDGCKDFIHKTSQQQAEFCMQAPRSCEPKDFLEKCRDVVDSHL